MKSKHTYTATLLTDPEVELQIDDDSPGSIVLDAGRVPHMSCSLQLKPQSMEVLEALDPRVTPRIRLDVVAEFPDFTQTRSFDLGVRDRDRDQDDTLVGVPLASDEALLSDWAPLTDDVTPRVHESSLRDVVDYVLDKVIPGAALQASPALDADATRFWAVTNLIANPAFDTVTTGWGAGQGASSIIWANFGGNGALGWTAAAGVSNIIAATSLTTYRVTPGKTYVFALKVRSSVARTAEAAIQWRTGGGATTHATVYGAPVTTSTSGWTRVHVIATAPEGADHCQPFLSTTGNAAGNLHYLDDAMFYEGDELVPYFDGSTTDTTEYAYSWSDVAEPNASSSIREPLIDGPAQDSLIWRAGQTAISFLAPLVQVAGFRLVCNESREWTLRDETYTAEGSVAVHYGVNMVRGKESISRDSGLWFDARVTRYRWTDANGLRQERSDAYALNDPYTKLVTLDVDAPYPGPGRSEYAVRRAQGRGREVSATKVSDWSTNAEQPVSIVLEGAETQIGITQSVTFDLGSDEMTVESRTTDAPTGSIALLEGVIDDLVGTIDSL